MAPLIFPTPLCRVSWRWDTQLHLTWGSDLALSHSLGGTGCYDVTAVQRYTDIFLSVEILCPPPPPRPSPTGCLENRPNGSICTFCTLNRYCGLDLLIFFKWISVVNGRQFIVVYSSEEAHLNDCPLTQKMIGLGTSLWWRLQACKAAVNN